MATELVILLSFVMLVLLGVMTGDNGIPSTFSKAAPKLGAKIEKHIETGSGFTQRTDKLNWTKPPK